MHILFILALAANIFAQALDTAYVPVKVNADMLTFLRIFSS